MFLEDLEIFFSKLLVLHLHGDILDGFSGKFHFVFGFCFCKFVNLTEACVSFCRKNQLCDMFENWIDQTPEWHGSCPSPGDSGQEKKQWHEDRSNSQ